MQRETKRQFAGWTCLVVGFMGGVYPLIPGWVFLIASVILLKDRVTFFRWMIYKLQAKFPKFKTNYEKYMPKIEDKLKEWGL